MFRLKNPCKKCIVEVVCSQNCENYRQHCEDKIDFISSVFGIFLSVIICSIGMVID